MPQPGTSFSELPAGNHHHQFIESVTTTNTTASTITTINNNNNGNINLKYRDSNGEVGTMLANHATDSNDMSPRNFQSNHIDSDVDTQVKNIEYLPYLLF
uniref:Uncharacterized protein n=1 Tax=Elaeophora elaphi TaxID=1147741 RepID=A0A0R3RNL9_9BILA